MPDGLTYHSVRADDFRAEYDPGHGVVIRPADAGAWACGEMRIFTARDALDTYLETCHADGRMAFRVERHAVSNGCYAIEGTHDFGCPLAPAEPCGVFVASDTVQEQYFDNMAMHGPEAARAMAMTAINAELASRADVLDRVTRRLSDYRALTVAARQPGRADLASEIRRAGPWSTVRCSSSTSESGGTRHRASGAFSAGAPRPDKRVNMFEVLVMIAFASIIATSVFSTLGFPFWIAVLSGWLTGNIVGVGGSLFLAARVGET